MTDSKASESKPEKPKPTWHAHFKSGEDEPVAIFRDDAADYAQQVRKSMPESEHIDTVTVQDVGFNLKPDAKEHLKSRHDARFPPPKEQPVDDFKAAELRNAEHIKRQEDLMREQIAKEEAAKAVAAKNEEAG